MSCCLCWRKAAKVYLLTGIMCSDSLINLVNVSAQEDKVLPSKLVLHFLAHSLNMYGNEGKNSFAGDAERGNGG
jgi:hypothetical protein